MGKNNFVSFLATGVIILAYTIMFGFPENNSKNERVVVPIKPVQITDYSGTWVNSGPGYLYKFELEQLGNEIKGDHCFYIDNAAKIDCGNGNKRTTINGIMDGKRAIIDLVSAFSGPNLGGDLVFEGDKLVFEAMNTDEIVPPRIEFARVNDKSN